MTPELSPSRSAHSPADPGSMRKVPLGKAPHSVHCHSASPSVVVCQKERQGPLVDTELQTPLSRQRVARCTPPCSRTSRLPFPGQALQPQQQRQGRGGSQPERPPGPRGSLHAKTGRPRQEPAEQPLQWARAGIRVRGAAWPPSTKPCPELQPPLTVVGQRPAAPRAVIRAAGSRPGASAALSRLLAS